MQEEKRVIEITAAGDQRWEQWEKIPCGQKESKAFVSLPRYQTVEVEMLGGEVRSGEDGTGERVGRPVYASLQELPLTTAQPIQKEACEKVIEALRQVREQGEETMLMVSGPFTVLSGLVSMERIFVERRKNPELYRQALNWVSRQLISYMKQAATFVSLYSIADPAASPKIVGKVCVQELVREAYLPLLREVTSWGKPVHLCPRLAAGVLAEEGIEKETRRLPRAMNYEEALLCFKNQGVLLAGACIKTGDEVTSYEELGIWRIRE